MTPPLVAHVIRRLAVGGMENGLMNLINHMPSDCYRHAIVCLTDHTEFRSRIARKDVSLHSLGKREGQDLGVHRRIWRLFRDLRPAIVHTRNISGLEYLVPAALSGVTGRVHGEHGRDVKDLHGRNIRHNMLRRIMVPLVDRYVALSVDLEKWLIQTVGISPEKIVRICNGVDTNRFRARGDRRAAIGPGGFASPHAFVLGTVGRMDPVKDQLTLVRAFLRLVADDKNGETQRLRLVIVGDGPLRSEAIRILRQGGGDHLAWLPGDREDVPEVMHGLDLFVLPSLAEGVSNTILEAMASGLPVVATRVGGNPELVEEGETGALVPPVQPVALAGAISRYLGNPRMAIEHGRAGRDKAERVFGMGSMVEKYLSVYDGVLKDKRCAG